MERKGKVVEKEGGEDKVGKGKREEVRVPGPRG